jgi:chromatin structure-remodeling complex subunit RSC1/2
MNAYTDLSLVFWNALFYNEPGSQIALDADTLKSVLETEWQKRPVLPTPRHSPPPSSPQKVHGTLPTAPPQLHPSQSSLSTAKLRATAEAPALASGSMSTITLATPKPAPRRGTPPVHPSSPDTMDVDVQGMSPDPDGQADTTAGPSAGQDRDGDSEAIVRQLEKSLPRWEGFGDLGWMSEVAQERRLEIMLAIKSHKDSVGNRLAVALDAVPEEPTSPLLSYQSPMSLNLIEGRIQSTSYASPKEFDLDMARLFEKARRWYEPCTESYGRVLVLQVRSSCLFAYDLDRE